MINDGSFVTETVDLLQVIGTVRARRMFGGHGIFLDDLMFALIADNELYLKADQHSAHFFAQLELPAFSYQKSQGKTLRLSYYLAPDTFFEDSDDTRLWATRAFEAALRAPRKKKKR